MYREFVGPQRIKKGGRHVLGSIKNLIGQLGHERSRESGNKNRTTVSGRTNK